MKAVRTLIQTRTACIVYAMCFMLAGQLLDGLTVMGHHACFVLAGIAIGEALRK